MGGIPSSAALRELGQALRYGVVPESPSGAPKSAAPDDEFQEMIEGDDGWSDWIHPLPGYRMKCCGCGLIHHMEFQIAVGNGDGLGFSPGEGPDGVVIFRARRA